MVGVIGEVNAMRPSVGLWVCLRIPNLGYVVFITGAAIGYFPLKFSMICFSLIGVLKPMCSD